MCGHLLLIGQGAVDMDAVGAPIVVHGEVHRSPDVTELDEVVAVDFVCLKLDPLAVHVEGLAGGRGGEDRLRRLGGGSAQGQAGEDANSHKNCFSFSAHNEFSLQF